MSKIKLNSKDKIDLKTLVDSRLLIQANSGGGKSWLLRRLLEQSHGKIQQVVLDLEGEFSTLREKYDYILAAQEGDTPAEPKSAAMLAHKILELNVSAIVDLYELKHHERIRFVKLFLDAMVNAPKKLWHPVLVVVDEAHIFCPEKGQAESASAVIDLATRGRKRGYCAILATQRLSKLHKDAAAECNNKLIGRTGLDIDRKRASEELGFSTKEQNLSLRDLEAGEFFGFGPSISREVKKLKVGGVKTTHPKAGMRFKVKVAPPTAKIKSLLKKLGDLPEQAKKEAQTIQELKSELTQLKRHRCPKVERVATDPKKIESQIKTAVLKHGKEWEKIVKGWEKYAKQLRGILASVGIALEKTQKIEAPKTLPPFTMTPSNIEITKKDLKPGNTIPYLKTFPSKDLIAPSHVTDPDTGELPVKGGALRMLQVLVSRYPMKLTRAQLATFSKMSARGGSFGTYLSTLRTRNLIVENGGLVEASQEGIEFLGEEPNPPQTPEEVIEMWRSNLKGGSKRMFDVLVEHRGEPLTREALGEMADISHTGGSFGTYLSILRSNGLIDEDLTTKEITISENLFI